MSPWWYGTHTIAPYSRTERTRAMYAVLLLLMVTGWTSSSLGARSPGLRSRQIVLVLSVGDVRR